MADINITSASVEDIPQLVKLLDQLFTIEKDFRPDRERQVRGLLLLIARPEQGIIKVAPTQKGMG